MELFVIIVNGFQPLTIITKSSILDVAAVPDPPMTSLVLNFDISSSDDDDDDGDDDELFS